jgi:lipoprotein-anchoring transpeptidase ErfK/SrfK
VRKALVISLLAVAVLAGSGVIALHRYDASRADTIADGVTVAGVEVGGMTVPEAQLAVDEAIAHRVERPLTIRYEQRRFRLDPELVEVTTNADELVLAALAESREGSFLSRSYRDLTGGSVEVALPLEVDYSEEGVDRVVAGIRRELDRPARDAKAQASWAGVNVSPSQTGISVRAQALREAIAAGLVEADRGRRVSVPVRVIKPKVTTREVEDRFSHFIAVSRSRRQLRFFVDRRLVKTYDVGIGALGFETPSGIYEIESKAANPAWYVPNKPWAGELAGTVVPGNDPDNPIKSRWLGFWDGAGIHGTADEASIGTAASHGCIRMTVRDVKDLYGRVPLRTPISIA